MARVQNVKQNRNQLRLEFFTAQQTHAVFCWRHSLYRGVNACIYVCVYMRFVEHCLVFFLKWWSLITWPPNAYDRTMMLAGYRQMNTTDGGTPRKRMANSEGNNTNGRIHNNINARNNVISCTSCCYFRKWIRVASFPIWTDNNSCTKWRYFEY